MALSEELTELEKEGLEVHALPRGTLTTIFRLAMAWAFKSLAKQEPIRYFHTNSGIDAGLYTKDQIDEFPSKYTPVYLSKGLKNEEIK